MSWWQTLFNPLSWKSLLLLHHHFTGGRPLCQCLLFFFLLSRKTLSPPPSPPSPPRVVKKQQPKRGSLFFSDTAAAFTSLWGPFKSAPFPSYSAYIPSFFFSFRSEGGERDSCRRPKGASSRKDSFLPPSVSGRGESPSAIIIHVRLWYMHAR